MILEMTPEQTVAYDKALNTAGKSIPGYQLYALNSGDGTVQFDGGAIHEGQRVGFLVSFKVHDADRAEFTGDLLSAPRIELTVDQEEVQLDFFDPLEYMSAMTAAVRAANVFALAYTRELANMDHV